jgi:hypothetical protein
MTVPDALAFAGSNQATLNSCGYKEFGIGANFSFALWKVAVD